METLLLVTLFGISTWIVLCVQAIRIRYLAAKVIENTRLTELHSQQVRLLRESLYAEWKDNRSPVSPSNEAVPRSVEPDKPVAHQRSKVVERKRTEEEEAARAEEPESGADDWAV